MRFLINSYNNNNKNKQEIKTDFKDINSYLKYLITNHENENIIFQTFSWINKKVERCWECHNETTTFSTYYTYDLDLENALKIIRAINGFLHEEFCLLKKRERKREA